MPELLELFDRFDTVLTPIAPKIASRLQPGLTRAEIETQIASFSWEFSQDAFDLYQWHNGLSGNPGKLNLVEKLLRVKGKWHGELSGRENEAHLKLGDRLIVATRLRLGRTSPSQTGQMHDRFTAIFNLDRWQGDHLLRDAISSRESHHLLCQWN
jgi:hypothetical protein